MLVIQPTLETYEGYRKRTPWKVHPLVTDKVEGEMKLEDLTFDILLNDPDGRMSFFKHLVTEFSTENIDFFIEVKNYQEYTDLAPELLREKALTLLKNYVKEGGVNQVNLPSVVRKECEAAVTEGRITVHTFDRACEEIKNLMSKDSFTRYKRGPLCKAYVALINERHKIEKEEEKPTGSTSSLQRFALAPHALEVFHANVGVPVLFCPSK
jgi:hypothetical protein